MPVANRQIHEVAAVFLKHGIDRQKLGEILDDLRQVEAYKKNASFRETINRLSLSLFT